MLKKNNNKKTRITRRADGQVLLVVAVSLVAILAIMGLALDAGMMFIGNARMRRAVDAAALAAALQFHPGLPFQFNELDTSAREFLSLNGIHDATALVQVCDTPQYHPIPIHTIPADQCPSASQMQRKLVRVVATGTIPLAFLPVIGINNVPIAAVAISETASLDVVLVIDRSESMTWTANSPLSPPYNPMRDPSVCNDSHNGDFNPNFGPNPNYDPTYTGYCRPFDDVKKAAVSFVDQLYFPYDRVSVVTFDVQSKVILELSNNKTDIINKIKALTVFQGGETAADPTGIHSIYVPNTASPPPSRWYDPNTGDYWGLQCPYVLDPNLNVLFPGAYPAFPNPGPCTTTNIGAGLYEAGVRFNAGNANPVRNNSLWVVILLTDGVANAGYTVNSGVTDYFCPGSPGTGTWVNTDVPPICNNGKTKSIPFNRHSPSTSADYDAEDYAYDAADFAANGQNALIFTIGLGAKVTQHSSVDNTPLGELFLQYAAKVGHGLYTYAPNSTVLLEVFRKIAQNIATRLTH